ncbi:Methyltransferase domain-containing protein [Aquiflexum balticum DSM 16537]|uniref:Methyltransferase domain-containing protein n=1 Tax=Aquiflexum balticum DSM 16537 TaxID=758820 RepID=A0A1W2HBW3_9BACT|nr:methyltransferase domain-containing protein [Aquiflexum balticum]SMD46066.1 Methyltransferase domain-containing protein [Aquiflexum balticum DSM 16537]
MIKKILNKIKQKLSFRNSGYYWDERYKKGGNSGPGSYDHLAEFKAEVINDFVKNNQVNTVIEFGCGDGNQLKYFEFHHYTGFDVSTEAIKNIKETFKNDSSKEFYHLSEYANQKSDLTLSLDVIFHLVEDKTFEDYMIRLFSSAKRYVIIYSSDSDVQYPIQSIHVKHRKFSDWVNNQKIPFKLIKRINNKYPYDGSNETSYSDFFVFERI